MDLCILFYTLLSHQKLKQRKVSILLAYMFVALFPKSKLKTKSTKKIKNKILAIPAAPAAIPPKPNIAAMIATIKKITVQRNIVKGFIGE